MQLLKFLLVFVFFGIAFFVATTGEQLRARHGVLPRVIGAVLLFSSPYLFILLLLGGLSGARLLP